MVIDCCALHTFLRENQPSDDHFKQHEEENMQVKGAGGAGAYPQIHPVAVSLQEIES